MSRLKKRQQLWLKKENKKYPKTLQELPRDQWPLGYTENPGIIQVWRSSSFLVQAYAEGDVIRLSINRAVIVNGEWGADISWEELQDLKRQAGYGNRRAVEVYPMDDHIINVANMRHLWILPDDIEIGWIPDEVSADG